MLESKYPGVRKTISKLKPSARAQSVFTSQQEPDHAGGERSSDDAEWKGFSPSPPSSLGIEDDADEKDPGKESGVTVLYGIDSTKLSSAHKKALRSHSPYTKIVFNFPHVGGLSTDVNRQVRYNQELLVGFFKSAKSLLSSPDRPARVPKPTEDDASGYDDMSDDSVRPGTGAVDGQILVTLFEGEPYTLWNIRDLARHCGLKVVESFRFPWSAYPGYQHARTIGDIATGKDRSDEGKRKGAWRGEERDARCYVLEDKVAEHSRPKKKRKRGEEEDGDDA